MSEQKRPMRRCVGCMESKEKQELIRLCYYEGELHLDPGGKAKGRGVYLCPREECIAKAFKTKALGRSLGVKLEDVLLKDLQEELRQL